MNGKTMRVIAAELRERADMLVMQQADDAL
jgi:hypothetical protein